MPELIVLGSAASVPDSDHDTVALVLRDRFGQPWRVSAFLDHGDRFLEQLLERTDRNDLRAWAETLNLAAVLGRSRRRVVIGYVTAAAFLVAGVAYYLH